jgi:hypothetical protein
MREASPKSTIAIAASITVASPVWAVRRRAGLFAELGEWGDWYTERSKETIRISDIAIGHMQLIKDNTVSAADGNPPDKMQASVGWRRPE